LLSRLTHQGGASIKALVIDWEQLPTPAPSLRVPDRSHRKPFGPVRRGGSAAGLGVFAGLGRYFWILDEKTRPRPAYTRADGSAWFEASDGVLWYVDPGGAVFLMTHNRTFMALSNDGLLWTEAGGNFIAHTADGSSLSLRSDGSLQAFDAAGNEWTVGEDGAYYAQGPYGTFFTLGPDGHYYTIDRRGNCCEELSDDDLRRRTLAFHRSGRTRRWPSVAVALGVCLATLLAFYGTATGPFQPCVENGAGMKLCGGLAKAYCRDVSDPLVGRRATCNRLLGEHARIGSGIDPSLR
jgi:hypothetical protein